MRPVRKSAGKDFLLQQKRCRGGSCHFFLPLDVVLCGSDVWSQGMQFETIWDKPRQRESRLQLRHHQATKLTSYGTSCCALLARGVITLCIII